MEQRFCDRRHLDLEKYIETRFVAMERSAALKVHQAEERLRNKISIWALVAAFTLIVLDSLFRFIK